MDVEIVFILCIIVFALVIVFSVIMAINNGGENTAYTGVNSSFQFMNETQVPKGCVFEVRVAEVGHADRFKGMHCVPGMSDEVHINGMTIQSIPILRFRLAGLTVPDFDAFNPHEQCPEKLAKSYLTKSLLGKKITVKAVGLDQKNRLLVVVFSNNININCQMLEMGLAWLFNREDRSLGEYLHHMIQLEDSARARRIGIWQNTPVHNQNTYFN